MLSDIKEGKGGNINPHLLDIYKQNYSKAVSGVLGKPEYGDQGFNLSQQSQINVERLANFKAYHATSQLKSIKDDAQFEAKGKAVINTFNRYQATEYNTITARARTAHQFEGFQQHKELYPNIMWLPSRSAQPREEHMAFYYRVWPQDDPFWDSNQPGALWNCKCDWKQTDRDITDNDHIEDVPPSPGLDGNPGKTGTLITDQHPYISGLKDSIREGINDDVMRNIRNRSVKEGYEKLLDKKVKQTIEVGKKEKSISIGFNKKGINHFAHDFADDINFKNSLIPYLDKVVKNAKYETSVKNTKQKENPFVVNYHYFSFDMLETTMFLNIRETVDGEFFLYALTGNLK